MTYLHHVTTEENAKSILKNGLIPKIGKRSQLIGETEKIRIPLRKKRYVIVRKLWQKPQSLLNGYKKAGYQERKNTAWPSARERRRRVHPVWQVWAKLGGRRKMYQIVWPSEQPSSGDKQYKMAVQMAEKDVPETPSCWHVRLDWLKLCTAEKAELFCLQILFLPQLIL